MHLLVPVCADCGLIAVHDHLRRRSYCPVCGDNVEINYIEVAYAFKLLLDEMKSSKAGSLFIGLHGYSSVKDFTMKSVTRKVLNQAEDMAVCIVP